MATIEIVRCRPARVNWIWVFCPAFYGFSAAMAAQIPTSKGPPSPADVLFFAVFSVFFLLVAVVVARWLLRACVIGDDTGLRSRCLGGWRSATWDEISDYYKNLPTQFQRNSGKGSVTAIFMVEAASSRFGMTNLWSNADAFRQLVERQARNSRVSHWELKGTRTVDPWPRVFDYDTRENRWAPRLWLKLFLIYVGYLLVQPALQLHVMAGSIGWAMTFITAGLYLLLIGSLGLIFLLPLAQYRAASRRKLERITVDLTGIVFESETRRVEAAWSEITGYHIASGQGILARYAVQTRQGDFDFLPSIRNATLLLAIVSRFAVKTPVHDWESQTDVNALGGESARWSGGRIGVGAHLYHYRTRLNRALLWMPALLCLVFCLMAGLTWQGLLTGQSALASFLLAAGSGLSYLLGYYAYRVSRIESDEDGLTQVTLLGKRCLRWGQIENYHLTKERSGVVVGRAERISFSSQIVGYDELKDEIASKASCRGTWESDVKPGTGSAGLLKQ